MALPDYLREELIFLDLHPKDMQECLEMMVGMMAARGVVPDPGDALARLLERERTMSTGMGGGVAVPHAKTEKCREMTVALGRVADGVDFKAIDGKPVHLVFLLLGPPDSTRLHVDLLARIAYLVKTPGILSTILAAADPRQVMEALRAEQRERRV
ncbi:MAG TPA: PTS sugar transporter subunit IIA [Candidatus Polarisedimenticolia bacterium]|jgi:mannitol/fructose-specific phosphotransferase system IIA component (Ntr-type)